jgi:hypothetical protein
MRAQPVHHAIGIGIWITASEADQVHWISFEVLRDLSRNVMCALHQVCHYYAITNAFPAIGTKITLQLWQAT